MCIRDSIREAQFSDIEQICLIQESSQNSQDILTREILEERIRSHADTFLLASLNEQGIAYISATILTNDSLDKWIVTISKEDFRLSLIHIFKIGRKSSMVIALIRMP